MSHQAKGGASSRSGWPVRRFRLGEEPGEDLSATTSAEERLAMMWRLTLDAWASAGLALPDYRRADAPVRYVPLGSPDERAEDVADLSAFGEAPKLP